MLDQPSERRLVATLAAIQCAHILDFTLMMPLGPQLIRALQLTPQQFGWLISSYTFAAAISAFAVARVLDRVERKQALLGFYLVFLMATIACGYASSYLGLMVSRCLAGASGGVLNGILLTIIGDQVAMERRGKAVGTVMSAFAVATVIGVPLGLYSSRQLGWGAPFVGLGGLGLGLVLAIVRYVPSTGPVTGQQRAAASGETYGFGRLGLGLATPFFLMIASFSVVPYVSTALVANAKVPEGSLFLVYLVAGSVTFFTSRLLGRAADRFGKLRLFMLVGSASTLSTLLITHLGEVGLVGAVLATSLFMAFNSGRVVPLLALLLAKIPASQRGKFMALNSSTQQLASGVGAAWSGHLVGLSSNGRLVGFDAVCWCSVAALMLAMIALVAFGRAGERRV